jgi:hypothetical protein
MASFCVLLYTNPFLDDPKPQTIRSLSTNYSKTLKSSLYRGLTISFVATSALNQLTTLVLIGLLQALLVSTHGSFASIPVPLN